MDENEIKQRFRDEQTPPPADKGTPELAIGAGVCTYGTGYFLATGGLCPACLVIAPAMLGLGAYKRMKHNKQNIQ
ncbi:MAG: hypothetical protein ACN2B6_09205 [Rickettsiales bacterium]